MTMITLPRLDFARAVRLARRRGTLRQYIRVDHFLGRAAVIDDRGRTIGGIIVTDGTKVDHCPQCRAVLQVDSCCVIEAPVLTPFVRAGRPVERKAHLGRALLCPRCEYCAEASDLAGGLA